MQIYNCRLCDKKLTALFDKKVLGKYSVNYFSCGGCYSLQTELPYWLEESYAHHMSSLDTGAAQRCLINFAACFFLVKIFNISTAIDYGGGDGLLCRLLRDKNIKSYVADSYAKISYAQGYDSLPTSKAELISAFEVVEHFVNPQNEFHEIFNAKPRVLILSTELYRGQSEDWWYLTPESGQHIFFYSAKAFELLAHRYSYEMFFAGAYIIFVKASEFTPLKKFWIRLVLKNKILKILLAYLMITSSPGIAFDYLDRLSNLKTKLD